jgi:hypothetical protein
MLWLCLNCIFPCEEQTHIWSFGRSPSVFFGTGQCVTTMSTPSGDSLARKKTRPISCLSHSGAHWIAIWHQSLLGKLDPCCFQFSKLLDPDCILDECGHTVCPWYTCLGTLCNFQGDWSASLDAVALYDLLWFAKCLSVCLLVLHFSWTLEHNISRNKKQVNSLLKNLNGLFIKLCLQSAAAAILHQNLKSKP